MEAVYLDILGRSTDGFGDLRVGFHKLCGCRAGETLSVEFFGLGVEAQKDGRAGGVNKC